MIHRLIEGVAALTLTALLLAWPVHRPGGFLTARHVQQCGRGPGDTPGARTGTTTTSLPWDYHTLPASAWLQRLVHRQSQTYGELDAATETARAADRASYIEIAGGKHDYPKGFDYTRDRRFEMYGV